MTWGYTPTRILSTVYIIIGFMTTHTQDTLHTIPVVNIKCGGCEHGIITALTEAGLTDIHVDVATQTVRCRGDRATAVRVLSRLGYPEAESDEARSIAKKAKSFATCAVGTVEEGVQSRSARGVKFYLLLGGAIVGGLALVAVAAWMGWRATIAPDSPPSGAPMGNHGSASETFSDDATGLPEAVPSQTIVLRDGDTYEMTAEMVAQEVGNRVIRRLAYNRMIPGPRIQVERGATVTIVFTNALNLPTTLHSHGVRLDDDFDGLPITMGGLQKEMQPGETFRYTLTFPDAGVYWYHPHVREDYTQELGLYGNIHVTQEGYWAPVDREVFWIIDDFSENDPFFVNRTNKTMQGRYGNIFLINNQEKFQMTATTGERLRFFITNVANTRTFDLQIGTQPLRVVGGDIGRVEKEFMAKHIILGPAERIIVETTFSDPGTYPITHRGRTLGTVTVTGPSRSVTQTPLRYHRDDYAAIRENMEALQSQAPDKRIRLTIGMKGESSTREMRRGMRHRDGRGEMMGGTMRDLEQKERSLGGTPRYVEHTDGIVWEETMARMNTMSNSEMMEWMIVDEETQKVNRAMSEDWVFARGDSVVIDIYNDPQSMHPMQHPIHFHGQRFVILSRNGVPSDSLQWKDTALVRIGERMRIMVDMSNPGQWIAHCHIAEHMHAGMMFNFAVTP